MFKDDLPDQALEIGHIVLKWVTLVGPEHPDGFKQTWLTFNILKRIYQHPWIEPQPIGVNQLSPSLFVQWKDTRNAPFETGFTLDFRGTAEYYDGPAWWESLPRRLPCMD